MEITLKQIDIIKTLNAAAAIAQARFLTFGAGGLTECTAGGAVIGVSDTQPLATSEYAIGDDCSVIKSGYCFIEASAAIAKGAKLKSAADGKAVTAGADDISFAIALQAATGAGQLILCDFPQYSNPTVIGNIAFTDLTDTPSTITASKTVQGNAGGDALVFTA